MNITELVNAYKSTGSENVEECLVFLKSRGCSKTLSIVAIGRIFGYELSQAKEIVHYSTTWSDVKERDEKFQADLCRNIKPDGD